MSSFLNTINELEENKYSLQDMLPKLAENLPQLLAMARWAEENGFTQDNLT